MLEKPARLRYNHIVLLSVVTQARHTKPVGVIPATSSNHRSLDLTSGRRLSGFGPQHVSPERGRTAHAQIYR